LQLAGRASHGQSKCKGVILAPVVSGRTLGCTVGSTSVLRPPVEPTTNSGRSLRLPSAHRSSRQSLTTGVIRPPEHCVLDPARITGMIIEQQDVETGRIEARNICTVDKRRSGNPPESSSGTIETKKPEIRGEPDRRRSGLPQKVIFLALSKACAANGWVSHFNACPQLGSMRYWLQLCLSHQKRLS
jgi:hypothetical protein